MNTSVEKKRFKLKFKFNNPLSIVEKRVKKARYNALSRKFEEEWLENILSISQRENTFNKYNETYIIDHIQFTNYGVKGVVYIPYGLNINKLNKILPTIGEGMKYSISVKKDITDNCGTITFMKKFSPPDYVPTISDVTQLLCGFDINQKPVYASLIDDCPHLLITGGAGTGKSYVSAMVVGNLIYNNKDGKFCDIYLFQLMKRELSGFRYCDGVQGLFTDIKDVNNTFNKILNVVETRGIVLGNSNINDWNKLQDEENQMKHIFVVVDEIAFFSSEQATSSMRVTIKELEKKLVQIAIAGRSCGVHIIAMCQKPTKDCLNTTAKAQFGRLTLFQQSASASEAAIESTEATKLGKREMILKTLKGQEKIYAPNIELSKFNEYINKYFVPSKITKEQEKAILEELKVSCLKDVLNINSPYYDKVAKLENEIESMKKKSKKNKNIPDIMADIIIDDEVIECDDYEVSELGDRIKELEAAPKVSDKDKFDINTIKRFIEMYGAITKEQANLLQDTERYAGDRLSYFEKNKGILTSVSIKGANNKKAYYIKGGDEPFAKQLRHSMLINDFYCHMVNKKINVVKFIKEKAIKYKLDGTYEKEKTFIPDGQIYYKDSNGNDAVIFLEVDFNHPTEEPKLHKYKEYINLNNITNYTIVIASEGREELYLDGLNIFHDDFTFANSLKSIF